MTSPKLLLSIFCCLWGGTAILAQCVPAQPTPSRTRKATTFGNTVTFLIADLKAAGSCHQIQVEIVSDWFEGLKRVERKGAFEFSKKGHPVKEYPDNLKIVLRSYECAKLGTFPLTQSDVSDLRLKIGWTGAVARPAVEFKPEEKEHEERWSESPAGNPRETWYEVEIPTAGLPLSDAMEIEVLTGTASLGCFTLQP